MKILITCQYYWPDNFLITDIAEELVKKGHSITVLTGLPDYTTTKIPKEYKFGKRRKEIHNGVNIIRVPIIARRKGFFFRVLNYLSFFITSSFYAMTKKIEADVIFAYQLAPVLMVNSALIYKKKYQIPIFLYVLDLWPDQMKIWHVNEKNPIFKIMLKYCQKAYGSSDFVGITSKPFKDYLIDVCKVDKEKILYLPQYSEKLDISKTNKQKGENQINFIFAGNIGQQQNIKCLLDAIKKMKTKKDYFFHIYGNGTAFDESLNYVKELSIGDKVKFYGRIPKEKLHKIYFDMDALILTLCSERDIGYAANTVPAKLQNYMAVGKPIFASINGGANEIIKESNCGNVAPADDSKQFAIILDDFVDNPKKYENCGKNALDYFNKNFEKNVVMENMENILKELGKRGKENE